MRKKRVRRRGPAALFYYFGVYAACNLVFLAIFGPHFGYGVVVQNNLKYPIAVTPIDGDEKFEGVTPVILHAPFFLHSRRSINVVVLPREAVELYFDAVEHGPDRILFRQLSRESDLHQKVVPKLRRLARSQAITIEPQEALVGAVPMVPAIASHDAGSGGIGLVAILEMLGLWIPVCLPAMLCYALIFSIKAIFDKP